MKTKVIAYVIGTGLLVSSVLQFKNAANYFSSENLNNLSKLEQKDEYLSELNDKISSLDDLATTYFINMRDEPIISFDERDPIKKPDFEKLYEDTRLKLNKAYLARDSLETTINELKVETMSSKDYTNRFAAGLLFLMSSFGAFTFGINSKKTKEYK